MDASLPEHNFEQFLKELSEKSDEAWARLHFVLERAIKYWLLKYYGNSNYFDEQALEEIYQEAFSKLFEIITGEIESATTFESFTGLKSYAIGIAKNMANQHLRKSKKNTRTEFLTDHESYYHTVSDNDRYTHPDHIDDQDLTQKILDTLDYRERVILSRYSEGDKLVDIAEYLNISSEHCRIIKHRTMQKIAGKLNNIS